MFGFRKRATQEVTGIVERCGVHSGDAGGLDMLLRDDRRVYVVLSEPIPHPYPISLTQPGDAVQMTTYEDGDVRRENFRNLTLEERLGRAPKR